MTIVAEQFRVSTMRVATQIEVVPQSELLKPEESKIPIGASIVAVARDHRVNLDKRSLANCQIITQRFLLCP